MSNTTGLFTVPTLAAVAADVPLPPDPLCVFVSGAVIAGWGHANSDIDIYVVTPTPHEIGSLEPPNFRGRNFAPTQPPDIPVIVRVADDARWDIEFWTEQQIEQIVAKFAPEFHHLEEVGWKVFEADDLDLLHRMSIGQPLTRADWLTQMRDRIRQSSLVPMVIRERLDLADAYLEDALGLLASGDLPTAVITAREAFGCVVDAIVARRGTYSPLPKWRGRQLQETPGAAVTWDEFWSVQTMERYDEDRAEEWVVDLVERCRDVMGSLEVE